VVLFRASLLVARRNCFDYFVLDARFMLSAEQRGDEPQE